MTTPRSLLIPPDAPGYYHLISRCVRRSWLCGRDRGTDYSHRRSWLSRRLLQLGSVFALEVHAYAIMSNHFHLVIYSDPNEPNNWTDREVVERWLSACPPKTRKGEADLERAKALRRLWLSDPERINELRTKLGSISVFMKLLKQPIARRANLEDSCTGHFFEQRFYSGALLDQAAIVASMAYVDLNPVRARITRYIESCRDTSIEHRLNHSTSSMESYLEPVVSGLSSPTQVALSLRQYTAMLTGLAQAELEPAAPGPTLWQRRLRVIGKRQRAYGSLERIEAWLSARALSRRELALA